MKTKIINDIYIHIARERERETMLFTQITRATSPVHRLTNPFKGLVRDLLIGCFPKFVIKKLSEKCKAYHKIWLCLAGFLMFPDNPHKKN